MSILNYNNSGDLAQVLIAYRFLEAGRLPAWPLTVCAYDLLVDGGDGIFRIQVKKAAQVAEGPDTWRVHLTKKQPIPATAYDYLVIWCDANRSYVIPAAALQNAQNPAVLVAAVQLYGNGDRFSLYLNRFNLGSGEARPCATLAPGTSIRRRFWFQAAKGEQRKQHKRLSAQEVDEILHLPIRWFKKQEQAEGLIPIEQVAQQFGVSVMTLRNYLRGKGRKDLRTV